MPTYVFRASLLSTGGGCLAYAIAQGVEHPPTIIPVLVAFLAILLGDLMGIEHVSRGSTTRWSFSDTAAIASVFILGPWVTMLVAAAASVVSDVRDRSPMWSTLCNAAEWGATLSVATLVGLQCGWTPGYLEFPNDIVATIAVTATYSLVNILITLVLGPAVASDAFFNTLRERASELGPLLQDGLIGSTLGILGAIAFQMSPWALLYVVPVILSVKLAVSRGVAIQVLTDEALEAFANIVDERDPYTAEHSLRVCEYSMAIGRELGLTPRQAERLYWTSRLHDLGKISVDNTILNKPGKLTEDEFEVIRQHPVVSARVLSAFAFREHDAEIVLCHHERFDGRGYLKRSADEVPFEAFVIAVADTYDAMTSDRPYRKALPRQVALEEIERNMGTQFHPVAAKAFLQAMGWLDADGLRMEQPVVDQMQHGTTPVSGQQAPPMAA